MTGTSCTEELHRRTSIGLESERRHEVWRLDLTNQPSSIKSYRSASTVPLQRSIRSSSNSALSVLSGHVLAEQSLDDGLLSTLLFLAAGVTRGMRSPTGAPVWFRTAMSAGNLHPIELYLIRDGVWHYDPLTHSLTLVRVPRSRIASSAGAHIVVTGIPFRTCWKYAERGYRHLFWDAGTLLANLFAASAAHGVSPALDLGFIDHDVSELVGIDGIDEIPIAVVRLGQVDELPTELDFEPPAVARPAGRDVSRMPDVVAAVSESVLLHGDLDEFRRSTNSVAHPVADEVALPDESEGDDHIEDVILRRGSTRRFSRETAPSALLTWALPAATRALPWDIARNSSLIEHAVNVHDVEGFSAGSYRFDHEGRISLRHCPDDIRSVSKELCLHQEVGGDSAFTVFHASDLTNIFDQVGPRGYRAAQLEAGVIAGRLALNAFALGYGATGLTFSDALVSRHLGNSLDPLLVTAIGVPTRRPSPSGTPGSPYQLNSLS